MASYYVNAATGSNANAGTSPGAAWETVQYALTNTVGEDRINLADAAPFSESGLSLPDNGGRYIAGYTSAEGDGGVFEIDGGGSSVLPYTTNNRKLVIENGIVGNCGSSTVLGLYFECHVRNLKIHTTTGSSPISAATNNAVLVESCWFTDLAVDVYQTTSQRMVFWDCFFEDGDTYQFGTGFGTNNAIVGYQPCINCVFHNITASCWVGQNVWSHFLDNAILGGGSNVLTAVRAGSTVAGRTFVFGNRIENAAVGIYTPYASSFGSGLSNNQFYDCTTNYTDPFSTGGIDYGNESLGSSPFAKTGSPTFANRATYFARPSVGGTPTTFHPLKSRALGPR